MPTRARLHRLAACVVLLWLFALTSGVVNACVVASGLRHAAHAVAADAAQDHAAHATHAAATHGAQYEEHDDQPPCERLCDEPVAPVQADKQQGSVLSGFWLAAAPLPSCQQWLTDATTAPLALAEPASRTAIPIPIAFLRLAL